MQLLGGDQREAVGKVEPHLIAEHRERAGAGAVALLHTLFQDAFHQVEVLAHANLERPTRGLTLAPHVGPAKAHPASCAPQERPSSAAVPPRPDRLHPNVPSCCEETKNLART